MVVMTAGHVVIPRGRPFTVADLEAMPDDGNRNDGAGLAEIAHVAGEERFAGTEPFPVEIVAARMLRS